jgi:hypothetical protein
VRVSDIASKWGEEVAGRGFAQVPNYLLLLNQFLAEDKRLSPTELLILMQLVGAWWKKDEMPFPALKTLGVRAGVSDRQAQRAVTRLEEEGYLRREKRKRGRLIASNAYNLEPLVEILKDVAKAFPNEAPRRISKPPPIIRRAPTGKARA